MAGNSNWGNQVRQAATAHWLAMIGPIISHYKIFQRLGGGRVSLFSPGQYMIAPCSAGLTSYFGL